MYIRRGKGYKKYYLLQTVVELLVLRVVAELSVDLPQFFHEPPPGREGGREGGGHMERAAFNTGSAKHLSNGKWDTAVTGTFQRL